LDPARPLDASVRLDAAELIEAVGIREVPISRSRFTQLMKGSGSW
jgi:hypothetical protein